MRLLTIILITATVGSVFAEEGGAPAGGEKKERELNEKSALMMVIKKLDTDTNGELSKTELEANKNEKLAAKLGHLDTNQDGNLDKSELEAGKANWAPKKEGEKKEGEKK